MKRSTRTLLVALVLMLVLAAFALPAAAHGFGPAFYCDAGTLNNCTDTGDIASADDSFDCEGNARGLVSCTNRVTGEVSPYCPFLGQDPGRDLDYYRCGPAPEHEGGNHRS